MNTDDKTTEPSMPAARDLAATLAPSLPPGWPASILRHARAGYDGYRRALDGRSPEGDPLPPWEALSDGMRDVWAWVVAAIFAAAWRDHRVAAGSP